MFYEPDQRYSVNRKQPVEADDPLDSPPLEERGQFWNVSRSVRGAAVGAGLFGGWWFQVTDPYDLRELISALTGTTWVFPWGSILGGAVVALIGASIRGPAKSED